MSSVAPFFRFGVIGDPQYGDKVDAFVEGRNQRYREVPGKLQEAAEKLSTEDLTFVLVMGDLIDGQPTEDSQQMKEARAYWESHPLSDSKPNMMEWNGGLSQEQMRWLDSELAAAEAAEEKLVVASHHPIGKDCARPTHMVISHIEAVVP
eukprot:gene4959-34739_t